MPRLIVDDSGAKRAFRLSNGRLSIGSATTDKLRLASSGVEAQHAQLIVDERGVHLEAKSAVEFAGQRRTGTLELPLGSTVVIGAAKLTVAADAESTPSPAPAVPARPVPARPVAASEAKAGSGKAPARVEAAKPAARAPSSGGKGAAGRAKEEAPVVSTRRRSAPAKKGGLPGWAIPVGLLVLVGGGTALFMFNKGGPSNPDQLMTVVQQLLDEVNIDKAKEILADFDRASLNPAQQKTYDGLLARANGALTEEASTKRNLGIRFAQDHLLNYCDRHVDKTAPQKERVRLFLERLAEFRQLYPEQKGPIWQDNETAKNVLAQVSTLEQTYGGVARLSDPLTSADVEWARTYFASGGKDGTGVREYQPVLERLAKAEIEGGVTAAQAAELRKTLLDERNLYIFKRIDDAKLDFTRYTESKDVESLRTASAKLIHLILKNPDAGVRDTVSGVLLKFPNLAQEVLPSWRDNKPADWQVLLTIPGIAALEPQMPPRPGTPITKSGK